MTKTNKLLNAIEHFRFIDSGMHAQAMCIFLQVAEQHPNEVAMADLSTKIGVSQASVSRNVALLSSLTRYKTKGPNLLEAYEDKMERRRKLVKLTNRGLKFYNDLKDKL
tara:strand:- start:44 stop:370 length:327 start_codon:yes stop_codon:yes gene_type:complete